MKKLKKWWDIELDRNDSIEFRWYLRDKNYMFDPYNCFEPTPFVKVFLTNDEVIEVDKWLEDRAMKKWWKKDGAIKKCWSIDLNERDAIKFRQYLLDNNYKFETSGCFELVYFEVFMTNQEAVEVDKWLDKNISAD